MWYFPAIPFSCPIYNSITLFSTVVNQFYNAEITTEYVMRGNAAILKCLIPSFVADFVHVTAWINDEGDEIIPGNEYNGGKMGI